MRGETTTGSQTVAVFGRFVDRQEVEMGKMGILSPAWAKLGGVQACPVIPFSPSSKSGAAHSGNTRAGANRTQKHVGYVQLTGS